MQFKTKEVQEQYRSRKLHKELQDVVLTLEVLAGLYKDDLENGITITCIHRPEDTNSFHSIWQGIDIRTRDWSATFKRVAGPVLSLMKKLDRCIQHEFESDHLHLEYDNNDQRVKGA